MDQFPAVRSGHSGRSSGYPSRFNEQSSPGGPGSVGYNIIRTQGSNRAETLATALGWFSIGLGVAQLLAPRAVARVTGVDHHPGLMRAVGVRELASGIGILSQEKPAGWLWSRVAGDAMDLAMLGRAARAPHADGGRLSVVGLLVAGVAILDLMSSLDHTPQGNMTQPDTAPGEVHVQKRINVNCSPNEAYRFWRNFDNFPRFMKHLESVTTIEGDRSHWVAKAPAGGKVEWDAEVTVDRPGELLAWRSLPGANVDNAGTVGFETAPGGRGTIVDVHLYYRPPGGRAGALVAKLFGEEPSQQIDDDLRRFKALVETGVIATTVGQSSGPRSALIRLLKKGEPG